MAIRYNNLGAAYDSLGETGKAIEYYERALAEFIINLGKQHPNIAFLNNSLGEAYRALS